MKVRKQFQPRVPPPWKQTIAINLTGTFLTIKYAAPHLKRQGGAIVVCASVNGTRIFSNSGASAYATSKAGQVALAKMLAGELGRHKVRVNVICPGAIDTEIDDNTEQRDTERAKVPVTYPEGFVSGPGYHLSDEGSAGDVGDAGRRDRRDGQSGRRSAGRLGFRSVRFGNLADCSPR